MIQENCSVVKGEKEEFNVSLILTRIEFEQINWKNCIFYLSERTKKNSKEEKINKIQQEFSQRESCLLSKQDFFFGGEGVGALRESSLRGCESQITWVVVVFCFLFVLFSFFLKRFKFKFSLIFESVVNIQIILLWLFL